MSLWTPGVSPTALIEETLKARKLGDAASIGHQIVELGSKPKAIKSFTESASIDMSAFFRNIFQVPNTEIQLVQ